MKKLLTYTLLACAITGAVSADNVMDKVDKNSQFYKIVSGSKKMMGAATAPIGGDGHGAAPYAIFVPNDAALGAAMKGKDKEQAKDIIMAHVVSVDTNDDAKIREQLAEGASSIGGSTVTLADGKVAVDYDPDDGPMPADSPKIIGKGVKTGNGHVYKISGVLNP